jgi:VanZ family protein
MNPLLPLLPVIYMASIYLLSSIPGHLPDNLMGTLYHWIAPGWQNLIHIPLYAGLTFCWIYVLAYFRVTKRNRLLLAFLLTALWGVLDEIHQTLVPGRYGSLSDMALNLSGTAMAVVVYASRRRLQGT